MACHCLHLTKPVTVRFHALKWRSLLSWWENFLEKREIHLNYQTFFFFKQVIGIILTILGSALHSQLRIYSYVSSESYSVNSDLMVAAGCCLICAMLVSEFLGRWQSMLTNVLVSTLQIFQLVSCFWVKGWWSMNATKAQCQQMQWRSSHCTPVQT